MKSNLKPSLKIKIGFKITFFYKMQQDLNHDAESAYDLIFLYIKKSINNIILERVLLPVIIFLQTLFLVHSSFACFVNIYFLLIFR